MSKNAHDTGPKDLLPKTSSRRTFPPPPWTLTAYIIKRSPFFVWELKVSTTGGVGKGKLRSSKVVSELELGRSIMTWIDFFRKTSM